MPGPFAREPRFPPWLPDLVPRSHCRSALYGSNERVTGLRHHRPRNTEARAAEGRLGDRHLAVMPLDGALHDGKAQAEPGLAAGDTLELHERLKHPVTVGLGNSRTVIVHEKAVHSAVTREGHADGVLRVPGGIVEEVLENGFHQVHVAPNRR